MWPPGSVEEQQIQRDVLSIWPICKSKLACLLFPREVTMLNFGYFSNSLGLAPKTQQASSSSWLKVFGGFCILFLCAKTHKSQQHPYPTYYLSSFKSEEGYLYQVLIIYLAYD